MNPFRGASRQLQGNRRRSGLTALLQCLLLVVALLRPPEGADCAMAHDAPRSDAHAGHPAGGIPADCGTPAGCTSGTEGHQHHECATMSPCAWTVWALAASPSGAMAPLVSAAPMARPGLRPRSAIPAPPVPPPQA